jgi:hypothetical protein
MTLFANLRPWAIFIVLLVATKASGDDNYSLDSGETVFPSENISNSMSDDGAANGNMIDDPVSVNASGRKAPVEVVPSVGGEGHEQKPGGLIGDGSVAPIKNGITSDRNEFGGVPALPGTRRNLATGEAPEIYLVEDGDTMFDVCSQLIDDSNYWPKLWALNPDVRNPHFIYPGMKLAFYSGDTDSPPFMEVVSEDDVVPIEKIGVVETELVADPTPTILKGSEGGSVKVLRSMDDPSPVSIVSPGDIDAQDGVIYTGRYHSSDDFFFTVPAFYFSERIEGLGEIVAGISGERLVSDGQKVFVSADSEIGSGVFSVLRPHGFVDSPVSGDEVGIRYEFVSHIRIIRKNMDGLMEATAFEARTGLQPGDIVVKYMSTHRRVSNVSAVGAISAARSSVIGFSESGQHAGGKGDLVFLEKSGLSVGGFYSVYSGYRYRDVRHRRNDATLEAKNFVGIVRVVEISEESAIGLIVGGDVELRVGDTLYM